MDARQQSYLVAAFAGLFSSALFFITLALQLGFPFIFLPSLPLLSVGLSRHAPHITISMALATVIIAAISSVGSGLFFLACLALPSWYMSRLSLRTIKGSWFPVGLILTYLTLYACATIALMTLFFTTGDTSLPQWLSKNIHIVFSELQGEFGEVVDAIAGPLSFLVFSVTIWLAGLTLYLHAWIATRGLKSQSQALRPDYGLVTFAMPSWMLTLLAICALASLIGSESMAFLGKTTLVSLLFPYFLLGAARIHHLSINWPNRRIFLFFMYFTIFAQLWTALIVSAVGLVYHIKSLSAPKTSSRS